MRNPNHILLMIVIVLPSISSTLDLSEWIRSGKQLDGQDASAIGLVSALQRWATTLETDSSSLKDDLASMKQTNAKLVDDIKIVQAQSINLNNEVSQANERSMNIKALYQKLEKKFEKVEDENKELKLAVQSQINVIKSQQERIESNNEIITRLKSDVNKATSNLESLKGKNEAFSVTVTDKFLQLQPIMQNITKNVHDLTQNSSKYESKTSESVEKLEKMISAMDSLHQQTNKKIRQDLTAESNQNIEKCRTITENLEKKVLENLENLSNKDENLRTKTDKAISLLKTNMDSLSRQVDLDRVNIDDLRQLQTGVKTNLEMIKDEISRSVDVLTSAMERNVTESISEVEREVRKLEDRASSMSSSLVLVNGNVDSLNKKSDKFLLELNKIKSHTQRSVDTSAGIRSNMIKVEGKLKDVESKNNLLETKLEKLNVSVSQDRKMAQNTLLGLERLGETVASVKGEVDDSQDSDDIKNLEEKLASLSVKQLSYEQEITRNTGRLNKVELDMNSMTNDHDMESTTKNVQLREEVTLLGETLTTTRNTLAEVLTKMDILESQGGPASRDNDGDVKSLVNTLKTNVIGLGNYINTINREVNNLASRTRDSLENVNQQVVELTADVKMIEDDVGTIKENGLSFPNSDKNSGDLVSSSLRTDVAGLSTKLYTLKTNVFEINGELTGIKSGLESLNNVVKSVDLSMKNLEDKLKTNNQADASMKTDISTLRSGMSGLTNSILTMKSQIKSIENVDDKIKELSRNVTDANGDIILTRDALTKLSPEVALIATDISSLRSGITRMSRSIQSMADPPRFSCGVTGDEVKVSGVISYDECGVNTGNMMNTGTGHATVPTDGDYLLTFSANMVSSNSQAVWCALYKQSPGDQGWQVLGMINNYQSEAGEEDDRDSGSLTVLTSLKTDDQVWVEWRGYGDSFLYSNPYKLISFSGFLVTAQL